MLIMRNNMQNTASSRIRGGVHLRRPSSVSQVQLLPSLYPNEAFCLYLFILPRYVARVLCCPLLVTAPCYFLAAELPFHFLPFLLCCAAPVKSSSAQKKGSRTDFYCFIDDSNLLDLKWRGFSIYFQYSDAYSCKFSLFLWVRGQNKRKESIP